MGSRRPQQRHGLIVDGKKPRLYKIRERMLMYCYSVKPDHASYNSYRGKGITVCDEWINSITSFFEWAKDNGYKDNLTIDRIDPNGNYEPGNCQFLTMSENSKKARLQNPKMGEEIASSKLTEDHVRAVRLLLKLGYRSKRISEFFRVGKTTISSIKTGATWKQVKENL